MTHKAERISRRFKRDDDHQFEYSVYFDLPIQAVVFSDKPMTAQQAVIQVMTDPEFAQFLAESNEHGWNAKDELQLLVMEQIAHDAVLKWTDEGDRYMGRTEAFLRWKDKKEKEAK